MPALHFSFSSVAHTLIGVIVSLSCFSQASTVRFRHLTVEDGLSASNILCFLQDYKGFMWIGTWKGLNRYDGYRFKTFRENPKDSFSLGGGAVLSLLEDRNGNLWVGTTEGLDRYDRTTETFIHYYPGRTDSTISSSKAATSLCEDRDGRIWVGTD